MKAYRFLGPGRAEFCDVTVAGPGPGEVLVEVAAVGVCHTDLTIIDAPAGSPLPINGFTLGHETSGWVHAIGPGVTGLEIGQPVLVYASWGCGSCRRCIQGLDHWCERGAVLAGMGRDGGLAEYQLVPDARWLVPLPDRIDVHKAAPLADAGLTPYHAIRRSIGALERPPSSIALVGVGGLGHVAVQIARAITPATTIAVDVSQQRLDLASALGAHHAVQAGPDAAGAVLGLTDGRGADVVIDFVGSDQTLAFAAEVAGSMGDIVLIGGPSGSLAVNHSTIKRDTTVTRGGMGSISELHEVVALAEQGAIEMVSEMYEFDDIERAYGQLREGRINGRAIISVSAAPKHPQGK
ncbi:NAD(P)-dependent alcohol dehydrogenase [Nocardia vaccinii]|uniref:NAD(P)-dependent alcohol dehydrogenase n=1 Tax=Nocardia vaccinii TaxID=1822 RepID=UPI0008372099|nr:NAD(P)-dependent alcohol dehydrogenase [Nocardia vaccinii]